MEDATSPPASNLKREHDPMTETTDPMPRYTDPEIQIYKGEYDEPEYDLHPGQEGTIQSTSPVKEDEEKNDNVSDKDTEIPLIEENLEKNDFKLDGEDTLTLHKKKSEEALDLKERPKRQPPMYLFPITRMRLAWTNSANIWDFLLRAVLILFSTLGWFFCVGGVPFVSLVMLIIGSVYKDDCKIQPNIPVYLIVAGVFGTIQHVIALWTKYVPKESQGRLRVYRAYCKVIDSVMHLFLAIWFVVGCVWIYGVYNKVDYNDGDFRTDEFCNKTLYLFSFWILNFSFIVLGILIVLSLCCILFIVTAPKDVEKGIVQ